MNIMDLVLGSAGFGLVVAATSFMRLSAKERREFPLWVNVCGFIVLLSWVSALIFVMAWSSMMILRGLA